MLLKIICFGSCTQNVDYNIKKITDILGFSFRNALFEQSKSSVFLTVQAEDPPFCCLSFFRATLEFSGKAPLTFYTISGTGISEKYQEIQNFALRIH